jgi:hypothetical protein
MAITKERSAIGNLIFVFIGFSLAIILPLRLYNSLELLGFEISLTSVLMYLIIVGTVLYKANSRVLAPFVLFLFLGIVYIVGFWADNIARVML